MGTPEKETPVAKKRYGKRPLWQWIVIYIVVAAIVYYGIYLIFFHHVNSTAGIRIRLNTKSIQ